MEPLQQESVTQLMRSPVRQELLRRLIEGQTAVWLLLESGNADQDNRAAEFLEQHGVRLLSVFRGSEFLR